MVLLFKSDIEYFAFLLQAPFTILKTGPTRVEQNAPFNFEVTVVFARAASDSLFSASSLLAGAVHNLEGWTHSSGAECSLQL